MDQILTEALARMSPEEQVIARNTIYALIRTGFTKRAREAADARVMSMLPHKVVDEDHGIRLMSEINDRGVVIQILEQFERLAVPSGEKVTPLGANGIPN